MTFPFCVGGPDFKHKERFRRGTGEWQSAFWDLNYFTEMCARRVEAQIRWDWDLGPGLWSLAFASKVNMHLSMAYTKSLKRLQYLSEDDQELGVGEAAKRIYHLLWHGEYWDESRQKRVPMQGNVSKLLDIIGLGDKERALIRNSQFMSGTLSGTRQIRRSINHIVFSSRIVYGNPIFMTVTPSERHSGLLLRLSRHRRNDPALASLPEQLRAYAAENVPSLYGEAEDDIVLDLPEYDHRRLLAAKDPLSAVNAFWTWIRKVFAPLYGLRVCPICPRCSEEPKPCCDSFGSNGTPLGGSAGRADAAVGVVEAQKAEGVLHLHLYMFSAHVIYTYVHDYSDMPTATPIHLSLSLYIST